MDEIGLAQRFEEHRRRLGAIAYRMLGSSAEAEDVVQEVWLRVSGHGVDDVRNLAGWLTTVAARICLDHLRVRALRPEEPLDDIHPPDDADDPQEAAVLADSIGVALLVVLDTLTPAERMAFVLHDLFDVPFAEIAPMINRSVDAAKMLASRARRRLRIAGSRTAADLSRQHAVVQAFLAAARTGDMAALLEVLDPDAVVRADAIASPTGEPIEVAGARRVAERALSFAGRIAYARTILVDGSIGIAVAPHGRIAVVLIFTLIGDRLGELRIVADPARLQDLHLVDFDDDQTRWPRPADEHPPITVG